MNALILAFLFLLLARRSSVFSRSKYHSKTQFGDVYLLLARHSSELIVLVNARDGVYYASPSWESMLGYPPHTLLGQTLATCVHSEDLATFHTLIRDAHQLGVKRGIYRIRNVHGEWRWISVVVSQMMSHGNTSVCVIGHDITERRQLEHEVLQMQRLDVVGHAAASAAHDLNNLLMGIAGFAEISMQALPSDHTARGELEAIVRTTARASTLARQLLGFARLQPYSPRPLVLNDVVVLLERLLQRLLPPSVCCEVNMSPDVWPIIADGALLEQVIINLVVNARDALTHGGTITITTANVRLHANSTGEESVSCVTDYVVLEIADTGTGMDAATQSRVFEPFFTTKAIGRGTGLGLYTCKMIIDQCGGHIRVKSVLGQGTCISVYLPRFTTRVENPALSATSTSCQPEIDHTYGCV